MMPLAYLATSLLTLTLGLFAGFPLARASTSTTVTGTITGCCFEFIGTPRFADDNFIGAFNATDFWTGGISGTCTDVGTGIHFIAHGFNGTKLFHANFHGFQRCNVTVLGRTGTLFMEVRATNDGELDWHGAIINGTGGLAGTHGVISRTTLDPVAGIDSYSGEIHFDPS